MKIMGVALAAAALALAGCGGSDSGEAARTVTRTVGGGPETAGPPAQSSESTPAPGALKFGQTWKSRSTGNTIRVSHPARFTVSGSGVTAPGFDHHAKFTVSVRNNSSEPVDGNTILMQVTTGERPSQEAFDVDRGVGVGWRLIQPGRTLSVVFGYGYEPNKPFTVALSNGQELLTTFDGVVK